MKNDTQTIFAKSRYIAIEQFDNGALLLNTRNRSVTELDKHQTWIFNKLDGDATIDNIVKDFASTFGISFESSLKIVDFACDFFVNKQFARLISGSWKGDTMNTSRYIQNPDVNIREEDEDGALLFNPDTDSVKLLNSTCLYIWKLLKNELSETEIIDSFKNDFTDVPEDQVATDVDEFITHMVDSGFIGVVQA